MRIYSFEETPGIFRFVTSSLEISDKAKLHPWKSYKIVSHPLQIWRRKTKTLGNFTLIFLAIFFNEPLWNFLMLNSSVLLKILYPQLLALPCLYFFLDSPFIISDVNQHLLTWHSSWKVKIHTTIIFSQKTLLDMEWVHSFHLTWKMYYKMILLEVPWNGLKIHIEGQKVWRAY